MSDFPAMLLWTETKKHFIWQESYVFLCFSYMQGRKCQALNTSALLQYCILVRSELCRELLHRNLWIFLKKTMCPHQHSYNNIALVQGVLGKNNNPGCKGLVAQMFLLYFAKPMRFTCSKASLLLWQIWEQILHQFPPAQKSSIMAKQTEKVQWTMLQVWNWKSRLNGR